MNTELTSKREQFVFLKCLYDVVQGKADEGVLPGVIAGKLQLSESELNVISHNLKLKGLISTKNGFFLFLTGEGIYTIREMLANPDKSNDYFPSFNSIFELD